MISKQRQERQQKIQSFIQTLEQFRIGKNTAALSACRRGFLYDDKFLEPYPFLNRMVPEGKNSEMYYLIAGLYAIHPMNSDGYHYNFGTAMRACYNASNQTSSFEKRFSTFLQADSDELKRSLFSLIQLAKSKNVPINYAELLEGLMFWNSDRNYSKKNWANSFWSYEAPTSEKQ